MYKIKDAVLVIYNEDPRTLCHGGNVRVHYLLTELAKSFDVTLLTLASPSAISATLGTVSYAIEYAPTSPATYVSNRPLVAFMLYFFGAVSRVSKIFLWSSVLFGRHFYQIRCLRVAATALLEKKIFNYIVVEHSYLGAVLKNMRTHAVTAIDFHNVHAFSEASRHNRWIGGLIERRARRYCDVAICCSVDDKRRLRLLGFDRVFVIPNGAVASAAVLPKRESCTPTLLFIGDLRYPPNLEGVTFFLQHVYSRLPGPIPFHILGYGSEALRSFSVTYPSVIIHGFVPEPAAFFKNAILVCPIFHGGGTRLKILSAFAAGIPVVTTPMGVEGLSCIDGTHVLLASSVDEFVNTVTALLRDEQLYSSLRKNAFSLVKDEYSWEKIGNEYVGTLLRLNKSLS